MGRARVGRLSRRSVPPGRDLPGTDHSRGGGAEAARSPLLSAMGGGGLVSGRSSLGMSRVKSNGDSSQFDIFFEKYLQFLRLGGFTSLFCVAGLSPVRPKGMGTWTPPPHPVAVHCPESSVRIPGSARLVSLGLRKEKSRTTGGLCQSSLWCRQRCCVLGDAVSGETYFPPSLCTGQRGMMEMTQSAPVKGAQMTNLTLKRQRRVLFWMCEICMSFHPSWGVIELSLKLHVTGYFPRG